MKRIINILLLTVAIAIGFQSCDKEPSAEEIADRKVMILYSAGFNSISSQLQTNISELKQGYVPTKGTGQDVVLIVSKPLGNSYKNQTSPVLIQMYKKGKNVVMDTVKTYVSGTVLASATTLRSIMSDIKALYPAKGYGLVFSSHATGWLPKDVYGNTDFFYGPRPSTIGQENHYADNVYQSLEMEIEDFAKAFPYHLDYLVIDACYGGCVEVAYALRGVTDYIAFSPAEILTGGFDYVNMSRRLLQENSVKGVCEDFYNKYASRTGTQNSATISLVKTSALGELAQCCKELFQTYRTQINSIDYKYGGVQTYFGGNEHWFYDLKDILVKAGISSEDKTRLEQALDACVPYKAHTANYYSGIDGLHPITNYSGLSMFLPSVNDDDVKTYYTTLSWNQITSLVVVAEICN